MPISKFLNDFSSPEIAELMALDQLKDAEYKETLESNMMTEEQRNTQLKKLLGFKG